MSILAWIAVLAAAWFVASLVIALVLGRYLRRAGEGVAGDDDELRPLDTGPLRLWLQEVELPRPRPGSETERGSVGPREPAA